MEEERRPDETLESAQESSGRSRKGKKEKKKRQVSGGNMFLHGLQHILLTATALLTVFAVLNSFLVIAYADGKETYRLSGEKTDVFENSLLFNQMMGRAAKDVLCFGAIRGQLETDGKFDGKKEVDVTAFANRYQGTPTEYITANYRLEDLIKWSQNGIEEEDVWMSGEEADRFLSRTSTVTVIDTSDYYGGTVSYLNSDYKKITHVKDVSGNQFDSGEYTRDDTNAKVLKNRYLSADGKKLEDHVSSFEEYYELCDNLQKTINDLSINYGQYLVYQDEYGQANTNLVYIIRKTIGKDTVVYSNIKTDTTDSAALQELIRGSYGRYLIYDPMNMRYETNTLIEESAVRYLLNGYEYAYPQDTQVMVAVNTDLPVKDVFYQAARHYRSYVDARLYYLGALACGLLYLLLLVVLTKTEGQIRKHDTKEVVIRLQAQDRIPIELMAAAAAVICMGLIEVVSWAIHHAWNVWYDQIPILIFTGGMALLASILFSFFYYSLVRRIKARTLWRNSLVYRLWKGGREWIRYISEHGSLLLRVLVPFILFAGLQVLLVLAGDTWTGWYAVLIAMDAAAGFLLYRSARARELILESIRKIKEGNLHQQVDESHLYGDNLVLARAVNSIGESVRCAVETSMKDERLKADLITNVSHDIKTPLTSIINYVDLIKREDVQDPQIREYIEILDAKSQRLKQLTDDLVEASKISSGNIVLHMEKINLVELINQSIGEFSEKFEEKGLQPIINAPQGSVLIEADSRRIYRVMENLFNNVFKYAMQGTRVYIDIAFTQEEEKQQVILSIKNISAQPVKVRPEELTERFIRGDESRTTEGSGLGLSIARNLTEAQNGKFEIAVDGDLFKVYLTFPVL